MKFLFILLTTCGLLYYGVFGVEEITMSVREEDIVTLHTGVKTNHRDRIRWYYKDIRIAQITGDLIKTCKDVQCKERLRDRLELDNQTGSLTITSMITSDAGLYKLKILGNPSSEKIFNVTVHDQIKTVPVMERETVTLCTGVENQDDVKICRFNDTFIAGINGYPNKTCTDVQGSDEGFRARLKLDNQTGSLIITNTRCTDSGLYKLQINSSSCSIIRSFNVIVNDSHLETPAMDLIVRRITIFGAVILVLTVAVAFGVKHCSTVRRSHLKKINMNLL